MTFRIEQVVVRQVRLPQREAFTTSFGTTNGKTPLIVELHGDGIVGYGESAVPLFPFYNHETPQTALHILRDFAIPLLFEKRPETPQAVATVLGKIIGNPFARAGLEMAYWDWYAKRLSTPLSRLLGGERRTIPVGVSIGLQSDTDALCAQVEQYLAQGYRRIKIKISPGKDLTLVEALYERFGDQLPLMVDANSAYRAEDFAALQALDTFPLLMIEQPLREGDLYQHAQLQRSLRTPICLDESVSCRDDAEAAIAMGSCRVVNIKPGRVAGLTEALEIQARCAAAGMAVWCGGMLETGIGRAHNMALASLESFTFPGDISESARYYHEDVVSPAITLGEGGTLTIPEGAGIGFEVDRDALERFTLHVERFKRS